MSGAVRRRVLLVPVLLGVLSGVLLRTVVAALGWWIGRLLL